MEVWNKKYSNGYYDNFELGRMQMCSDYSMIIPNDLKLMLSFTYEILALILD